MSDLPNKEVLLPPLPTEHEDVLTSPASPLLSKLHLQFGALHSLVNAYVHHSAETSTTTASATLASLSPPHRLLTPSTDLAALEMDQLYFEKGSHQYTALSTVTSNTNRPEAGRSSVISVNTAEVVTAVTASASDFDDEPPLASAPDFQLDSPRLAFPPALELALNLNGTTSPFTASFSAADELLSTANSTATPSAGAASRYQDSSRTGPGSSTPANSTTVSGSHPHSHTNSLSSVTNVNANLSDVNGVNSSSANAHNTSTSTTANSSTNQSPLKRLKSFTSRGIRKLSLLNLNLNLNLSLNMNATGLGLSTPSFSGIPSTMPLQPPMTSTPTAFAGSNSAAIGLPAPQVANGADGYFGNSSSNTPTSNSSYSNLSNYFNRKRSNTTSSSASSHSLSVKFTANQNFAGNQGGVLTTHLSGNATMSGSTTVNNSTPGNGNGSTLILVPTVESVESKFMTSNPDFSYDSQLDCLNYLNHLTIERKAMVDSVACLKQQLSKSGWLTPKDLNGMNLSDLSGIDDKINQLEELITKRRSSTTTSSN